MRHLKMIPLFFLLISLSGCVSLKAPQAAKSFQTKSIAQRSKQLHTITTWNINGAMSIQQNHTAHIANYSWQLKSKRRYTISLSSTMNIYNINIKSDGKTVKLTRGSQPPIYAPTASELLFQAAGYKLPINNLYYWIRGLPAPGKSQQRHDQYGHLIQLQQDHWQIKFLRYTHVKQHDLPQLIDLSQPISHAKTKVRIVIKNWEVN